MLVVWSNAQTGALKIVRLIHQLCYQEKMFSVTLVHQQELSLREARVLKQASGSAIAGSIYSNKAVTLIKQSVVYNLIQPTCVPNAYSTT